jgi:isopenicillin N synthase-like dioxygenase
MPLDTYSWYWAAHDACHRPSRACEEVGFFIITSHGVRQSVIDEAWGAVRAFFDLPAAVKEDSVRMDSRRVYLLSERLNRHSLLSHA